MNSSTEQVAQTRDEKGRITGGKPPVGFHTNPERINAGGWKKSDTPRYKLEQMMKLSEPELVEVIDNEDAPLFERKIANAIRDGNWLVVREMIDQVYGKAKESVDVTTQGESINPYAALTTEELRLLAKGK